MAASGLRRLTGHEAERVGKHALQHGPIVGLNATVADADGNIGLPMLRLDTLARLQAKGRISPGERAAGEAFALIFHRAQFNDLRAADPGRVRTGRMHLADDASESAERCRRRLAEIAAYLGGSTSPAASVVWSVCGEQHTVRSWSLAHNRAADLGCGVLVGALSALSGYFTLRGRSANKARL